jgi:hypothetical protein
MQFVLPTCAPADISGTLRWSTATGSPYIEIPGTQTGIGTGAANTAAILATDANAPAAKACNEYTSPNNTTDWFLPSKDELNELYQNRAAIGIPNSGFYWSSSEYSIDSDYAWRHAFNNGNQNGVLKGNDSSSVRAVRAF